MGEVWALLGAIQNGGGSMLLLFYLAYQLTLVKRDFSQHEKIYLHQPKEGV